VILELPQESAAEAYAEDERIEIRHNPETGETSVELEDVTALELVALGLVAAVVIGLLVWGRRGERRR